MRLIEEQYVAAENLAGRPTDCDIDEAVPEAHEWQDKRSTVVEAEVLGVPVEEGVHTIDGARDL